eukprot:7488787-Alexandrium_andersonii.AAC.1
MGVYGSSFRSLAISASVAAPSRFCTTMRRRVVRNNAACREMPELRDIRAAWEAYKQMKAHSHRHSYSEG